MRLKRLLVIYDDEKLSSIKIAFNQEEVLFRNSYDLFTEGSVLYVRECDYEKSIQILAELGIDAINVSKDDQFGFIDTLKKKTSELPILSRFPFWIRIMIPFLIMFLLLFLFAVQYNWGISKLNLENRTWCINKISYNKTPIEFPSIINKKQQSNCPNHITLSGAGRFILMTGKYSNNVYGKWEYMNSKEIRIYDAEQLGNVYNGIYNLKTNMEGTIELQSTNTKIILFKRN